MIAAATGSLLGGRLAVVGGRGARFGKGWEADFARFGVGAFGMVRPDWMRANAALILPISVAARTHNLAYRFFYDLTHRELQSTQQGTV
jgi:hypothetical protein